MAAEFNKILNSNENIVWEGRPQAGPLTCTSFIIYPIAIFFLIFFYEGISSTFYINSLLEFKTDLVPFLLLPYIFLFVSSMIFLTPLFVYIGLKKTFYAITDKRVIIQSGIIGTDFQVVDFDKINSMDLNVGIADKLFGNNSGTISIDSGRVATTSKGGTYSVLQSLNSISDPYSVFEKLKKVSHDIKTDIEYPNKLRPDSNPGYNTKY